MDPVNQRERQVHLIERQLALIRITTAADWKDSGASHGFSSLIGFSPARRIQAAFIPEKLGKKGRSTSVQIKLSISGCQLLFRSHRPILGGFIIIWHG
jgi:hypothetical protein